MEISEENQDALVLEMARMQESPAYFVEFMWGLTPQPLKPEYQSQMKFGLLLTGEDWKTFTKSVSVDWFEQFEKGKHITWQQWLILLCVEKALKREAPHKISVVSGHGIGKCLGKDTEILMADGSMKKVQDVCVGEKLMGDDSTPREVLSLARGEEEMFRIRYFDGTYYDVNSSHILSLVASQTHGKQKKGEIVNVSVTEYLKWSERKKRTNIGYKRSMELPVRNLPIDPYLLGLWLGDGQSSGGKIFNIDDEIIEYLREVGIGKERRDPRSGCWEASVVGLGKMLRSIGLRNNKQIPSEYLMSSKSQRLELLAGIIDTDGHRTKRQFSVTQKNKKLAEQIKWLAQSVGTHATINEVKKHCFYKGVKREGVYYVVNISRNTEIIPTKIARKKSTRNGSEQRDNLHFGFTVESLGMGEYYGFTIDGNRLFMLGDFTVTHNTATESWLLLWYLFCFHNSQVPCTAPTANQLFDVLWKEVKVWLDRMPKDISSQYEWTSEHVRMKENPETWFARAKTASKENTEALAGVHADFVCMLVDEGSGVEEGVYNTAAGALTNENVLFVVISNGTRTIGYFYDSHRKDAHNFQTLSFESQHSPVVDPNFIREIEEKHGKDSDEYRIRTGAFGGFPKESAMDDKGYVQLLSEKDMHLYHQSEDESELFVGHRIMGVDPAGEGKDKTKWVVRDRLKAKVVHEEAISNPKSIAAKTITLAELYGIELENFRDIVCDSFGAGADVAVEVAIMTEGKGRIESVNTGELCDLESDRDLYINKRAESYWKTRQWLRSGGSFVDDTILRNDLLQARYKRTGPGKIQIEPKVDLKKRGVKSPDASDALSLTFLRDLQVNYMRPEEANRIKAMREEFDKYSIMAD